MSTYYVAGLPYSSELYHHGIKGQKWGVRRFQNPDGSLTPAGVKRYGTVENFQKAQQGKTKRGMSDATKKKLKTAAKVAGIAALTGAAAYGAYKVGKGIQRDHENYLDIVKRHKMNELGNNLKSANAKLLKDYQNKVGTGSYDRDLMAKSDFNVVSQLLTDSYDRKISALTRNTDAAKKGASFIQKLSNAHQYRKGAGQLASDLKKRFR